MSYQENYVNLGKNFPDDNNQEKNRGLAPEKPVPSLIVFCPNCLSVCWIFWVAFGEFICEKLLINQQFSLVENIL